ncbi:hypothetical protein H5410_037525 [Solanum commersonii]|uniref:Uncharacterized protein n=1 Tax=Solanum commersonii TaxID=4109 RepID=A0A9J5Y833_SOLCO|nr:hypothetical protein H5410_037525 [Solanum commersonii]
MKGVCTSSCLYIVIRLLSIKSDWNTPQGAVDFIIDLMHGFVDPNLEIPDNFYKAHRLVSKLRLSSMIIDSYENDCIYTTRMMLIYSFISFVEEIVLSGLLVEIKLLRSCTHQIQWRSYMVVRVSNGTPFVGKKTLYTSKTMHEMIK